ncbi:Retrotransposon gag protein [Ceratobasidium sp. AG-Ba]|nr:Retrotransposon gag protein [Ceratobasidium sp. AG-Ba]
MDANTSGWGPEVDYTYAPPSRPDSRALFVSHATHVSDAHLDAAFMHNLDPNATIRPAEAHTLLGLFQRMHTEFKNSLDELKTDVTEVRNQLALIRNEIIPVGEINQINTRLATLETSVNTVSQYAHDIHRDTQALIAAPNPGPAPQQPAPPPSRQPNPQPPAPTTASTGSNGVKLAKPEKFKGEKGKATAFKIAVNSYLVACAPNAMDQQKVLFTISYLDGIALEWIQPYQEQEIMHGNVTWLRNWTTFWAEFDKRFGETDRAEKAHKKIRLLKQTKSVQEYLRDFQACATYLRYNDEVLRDMFYDGLNETIKAHMLAQLFDPQDVATTFQDVADRALEIDLRVEAYNSQANKSFKSENKGQTSNSTSREKLSTGDAVYMIGTDGRAVKGKIESIGRNARGQVTPNVKWAGQNTTVQVPFPALKKDDRPMTGTSRAPPPPPLAKGKGPGPMELDGERRKGEITCLRCQGKGHMARDCPSKPISGFEARIEEVKEPDSDDESVKDDA